MYTNLRDQCTYRSTITSAQDGLGGNAIEQMRVGTFNMSGRMTKTLEVFISKQCYFQRERLLFCKHDVCYITFNTTFHRRTSTFCQMTFGSFRSGAHLFFTTNLQAMVAK